jgi:hypothetical protein
MELAPRQHLRKWKGGQPGARNLGNMIRSYRLAHPDKAVICPEIGGMDGWAMVAAGASLPPLPAGMEDELRKAIPQLEVIPPAGADAGAHFIIGDGARFLVYLLPDAAFEFDMRPAAAHDVREVDTASGRFMPGTRHIAAGERAVLASGAGRPAVFWITAKRKEIR